MKRTLTEDMTIPNNTTRICEQQHVHKRLQRNMRLNLATAVVFRIFTVLEHISVNVKLKYANFNQKQSKQRSKRI